MAVALTATVFAPMWFALGWEPKTVVVRLASASAVTSIAAAASASALYLPKMIFSTARAVGPIDEIFEHAKGTKGRSQSLFKAATQTASHLIDAAARRPT
eukprot:1022599-Prymnesium_polylepis.1